MINCQQIQRHSIYNFVFGGSKDQRSTSLKAERLRRITEISEIKQDYYRGLQLGKTSENALRIIHMKLERQRLRRQSFEIKTEMEEEHLPQVQYPKQQLATKKTQLQLQIQFQSKKKAKKYMKEKEDNLKI